MIFSNSSGYPHAALQPRVNTVWALPISLAATFGISGGSLLFLISFPELLRWFSSLSVAFLPYFIQVQNVGITPNGLPHSAIQGSQDMCSFPWLFAAYHGLLRLVAPRHPPYTSIRLTILSFLLYITPGNLFPADSIISCQVSSLFVCRGTLISRQAVFDAASSHYA